MNVDLASDLNSDLNPDLNSDLKRDLGGDRDRDAEAIGLLESFSRRTGLVDDRESRRYLWTDAIALCTYLSLYRRHGSTILRRRARTLLFQVHAVLGHHAAGPRRGHPLGGVDEASWQHHPTLHGLRIGKPLPQRDARERFDESLEWQRDGQYFHYLTRWMHALEYFARIEADRVAHRWAVELCRAALAFVERDASGRPCRMVWKRSVDLDRVLVPSMGRHDPMDGWSTADELAASPYASANERRELQAIAHTYRTLDSPESWPTDDALGIAGVLNAAARHWFDGDVAQRAATTCGLLAAATQSLRLLVAGRYFSAPASHRLAFRELGLVTGLRAVEAVGADLVKRTDAQADRVRAALDGLRVAAAGLPDLQAFWLDPVHQQGPSWTEHEDINAVTLAASLAGEERVHASLRT